MFEQELDVVAFEKKLAKKVGKKNGKKCTRVLFKTHSAEDANSHLKFWREKKFDS
jgi:hypothetical protein